MNRIPIVHLYNEWNSYVDYGSTYVENHEGDDTDEKPWLTDDESHRLSHLSSKVAFIFLISLNRDLLHTEENPSTDEEGD